MEFPHENPSPVQSVFTAALKIAPIDDSLDHDPWGIAVVQDPPVADRSLYHPGWPVSAVTSRWRLHVPVRVVRQRQRPDPSSEHLGDPVRLAAKR